MSKTAQALQQPHLKTVYRDEKVILSVPNPLRDQGIASVIDTYGLSGETLSDDYMPSWTGKGYQHLQDVLAVYKEKGGGIQQ